MYIVINNVSLNFLIFYPELREKQNVKCFAPLSSSIEILGVDVNFVSGKEATRKLTATETEAQRKTLLLLALSLTCCKC